MATLSHAVVEAGRRISVAVDVVPGKGMHVYAPGGQYRAVTIAFAPHPLLRVHDVVYPKATLFQFTPLNEDVLVYDAPFRLTVDITVGGTGDRRSRLGAGSRLPLKGRLEYQACDERVCYFPASVPFEWTVDVKP